jgi:hypothetical protein
MSAENKAVGRFRSLNGQVISNRPDAFEPRLTTTRAKWILNELYAELSKHDQGAAEQICRRHNA